DPGQPVILMVMQDSEDMGNTISQNDLARSLHVSNPTVTASLKSLERQGYIERKPDPGDMRRKLPALTPLGKQAAGECRKCIESVSEEMLTGFSAEERQQLISFLRRMKDNLEQCER
ncbi:MAG: MarR family transcriptional regulator, partial [Oscillospiraceae bacterium]|nr:MarR family transcriptional regulator [Oscillospiraceae bacterium]